VAGVLFACHRFAVPAGSPADRQSDPELAHGQGREMATAE